MVEDRALLARLHPDGVLVVVEVKDGNGDANMNGEEITTCLFGLGFDSLLSTG